MKKLMFLLALILFAGMQIVRAQSTITGTVKDKDGALPGVTVTVKGVTGVGTITDFDGKYTLTGVPASATTLVFTFVGMKPQELAINGQKEINTLMEQTDVAISDVVVTAFGIKRSPKEMGVSVSSVNSDDITKGGGTNVLDGMNGKVAGLQINTINNGVNPDTKITLRGNRHLLASNEALVVLDGVPVTADYLGSINPDDIENVSILKGAGASALYGNDASNGVMIITTKRGSNKQKPTIKFSNTTTFEQVSYMPTMQTRFGAGDGENVLTYNPNYTFWIGSDRTQRPHTTFENQTFGPEYNGQMVPLGGMLADGSYQMIPYTAVPNQKLNFFTTGVTTQNDLSYSAGDETSNISVSAQNVARSGIIPGDKYNRSTVRAAGAKIYGIFTAEFTVGYTKTMTNAAGGDYGQGRPVYWNVLNTPPEVPLSQFQNLKAPFAANDGYFNGYYPNPYWQIANSRDYTNRNDLLGNLNLSLKPFKWLEVSDRIGLVYNSVNYNSYTAEADFSPYSNSDPWGASGNALVAKYAGSSSYYMTNTIDLSNDFLVRINKDFGDFSARVNLGTHTFVDQYNYLENDASGLVIPDFYNISNLSGQPVYTQNTNKRASVGVFGDVTLDYKKYAFLHFSGRNDWDSRLAEANRSFFYPAVDLSLILSDMIPAIKDGPYLSYLKVRGSLSKVGQVSLPSNYSTLPAYFSPTNPFSGTPEFPYGSNAGYVLSHQLSNAGLKPEITVEQEGGIEFGFLKDRIHLEADVYTQKTTDQTIPASISAATGFTSAIVNAGEIDNSGFEAAIKIIPVLNIGGVKWDFILNYTYNTSKVVALFPGVNQLYIPTAQAGQAASSGVSYAVVGQQFPAVLVSDVARDPQGHIIVDPVTGYPTKAAALAQDGHGNPNNIVGIQNTVSYKGFSFSFSFEYRSGNNIYNDIGSSLAFTGLSAQSAVNGRQPFVIPNSVLAVKGANGTTTYVPNTNVVVQNAGLDFWVNSPAGTNDQEMFVTSAAFWELREVTLSYDIPVNKFYGGKILKAAKVSLMGRNLLLWRPVTNQFADPEFNNSGASSNAVGFTNAYQPPPTRIFGFSVNLTF